MDELFRKLVLKKYGKTLKAFLNRRIGKNISIITNTVIPKNQFELKAINSKKEDK